MLVNRTGFNVSKVEQPHKVLGKHIKEDIAKKLEKLNIKLDQNQIREMLLTSEIFCFNFKNKKFFVLTRSNECFNLRLFVNLTAMQYYFCFSISAPKGITLNVEETFEESSKNTCTLIPRFNKLEITESKDEDEEKFDLINESEVPLPTTSLWSTFTSFLSKI